MTDNNIKPTRCIDSIMQRCDTCEYGCIVAPEWVETKEDLEDCTLDTVCIYGFDKGRPEDKPTEEEWKEFDEWFKNTYEQ